MKRVLKQVLFTGRRALSSNPFAAAALDPNVPLPYDTDHTCEEAFRRSVESPEDYWAEQAERVVWFKKYNRVLNNDNPPFSKWFDGGELNTCYNALDRHIEAGLGEKLALIHDSPVTGAKKSYTYKELLSEVSKLAEVLREKGVGMEDTVLIYMPMIPEAIIGMLACARLGAIHTVVFGGFAAKELSVRISHAEPRVILSASAGIEPKRTIPYKPILDEAIRLSDWKPEHCIIYNRKSVDVPAPLTAGRDLDWDDEMDKARGLEEPVSVPATHPLYLLHTSGTTGSPKGIVRPSGGHAVVMPWTMQAIYGMRPGEMWWAASDLGWVVGHSYICYAPLLYGATTLLYEGKPVGTPDAGAFFRIVHEYGIKSFFCAPTALRAIREKDHGQLREQFDISSLRYIFAAGEHLDVESRRWAEKVFKAPVLDHWWQTESGWAICASPMGFKNPDTVPPKDASGKPLPGWNVKVLNDQLEEASSDELGPIVVKMPLPPAAVQTFWKNDEKFKDTYFQSYPGYYNTMDAGMSTGGGWIKVMSRVDDVINVAGHRISGGALEEAILSHEDVVDCAVVGVEDPLKGSVPIALCVISEVKAESIREEVLRKELIEAVNRDIGRVASLKTILILPKLPKTRSGKIARNTIAAMANNKPYSIPVTIEDASVYPAIRKALMEHGLGQSGADPPIS